MKIASAASLSSGDNHYVTKVVPTKTTFNDRSGIPETGLVLAESI